MKLTALSVALVAALGMAAGCSTQGTVSQASHAASDAQAQFAIGRFYQGQARYEMAIDAYRRALAINPGHAGAHNGLGASLLLAGRNAEAIEQFKTGLQHQPGSAALWNNLGYAYALNGEKALAEIAYKHSLELDPHDYKTNINLAAVRPSPAQESLAASQPAPAKPEAAQATVDSAASVKTAPVAIAAPAVIASQPAASAANPVNPQTSQALPAAASVQVVEITPRVYEVTLPDKGNAAQAAAPVAAVAGAARISIPLRENMTQLASIDSGDFVLEIRNGNGIRHMALRTSRYLAEQGYATRRLTNQRGFNVRVTRVFHLPGYVEEATRLLAHLPKDTVVTETSNLSRGIHVRVVLGKDMTEQLAAVDAAPPQKTVVAALRN